MNEIIRFYSIKEMAEYLVDNNICGAKSTAIDTINRIAKNCKPYKNKYYFKKIKNNI